MRVRVTLTLMRTLKNKTKLLLANCMFVRMIWKAWNGMYVSPSMNKRMSHLEKVLLREWVKSGLGFHVRIRRVGQRSGLCRVP